MYSITLREYEGMKYYEYIPAGFDETKKYPLMIFLHGAGERGQVEHVKTFGPLHEIENGMDIPCVLIAPFCEGVDTWFNYFERIGNLIKLYRQNS
ncbi:MAG: hypothetical protein IJA15_04175, partial [Clostridia bacterium]|nr:hypothetical protein [Clostridia bacterium]